MLTRDELWLVEESALDEPADLLTMPEIKQHVVHDLRDEELGLRSLLERPEAMARAWRRDEPARRLRSSNVERRQPRALRAA